MSAVTQTGCDSALQLQVLSPITHSPQGWDSLLRVTGVQSGRARRPPWPALPSPPRGEAGSPLGPRCHKRRTAPFLKPCCGAGGRRARSPLRLLPCRVSCRNMEDSQLLRAAWERAAAGLVSESALRGEVNRKLVSRPLGCGAPGRRCVCGDVCAPGGMPEQRPRGCSAVSSVLGEAPSALERYEAPNVWTRGFIWSWISNSRSSGII